MKEKSQCMRMYQTRCACFCLVTGFMAITLYQIRFSSQNERLSGLPHSMNSMNMNKSLTHIKQRAGTFGREGLVSYLPALAPISTSVSMQSSPLSYSFTSATVRMTCSHCTKVWHWTHPICDASLSRSQPARCRFAP